MCKKFRLYYIAALPDGQTTGNSFSYTVSNNAESRVTLRQVKDKSFNSIPNSEIMYDSKTRPANNSSISGISDVFAYQTFIINLYKDSIECSSLFKNSGTLGVLNTVSSVKFGVNHGTGIFKNVKKVIVDNDNEGKLTKSWNPNGVKFARRITFYK
jgi:hypothetical protein